MPNNSLLHCNDCGGEMRVIDSRVLDPDHKGVIYRRRKYKCMNCGCKVYTLEHLKDMYIERLKNYVKKLDIS